MTNDKISKAQEAARKATIRLARAVNDEEDQARKRRNGRLMKLGILVEQFVMKGDLTLLQRLESAALEPVPGADSGQFTTRKVDRLDFELDEDVNWFERTREEVTLRKVQKPEKEEAAKPATAAQAHTTPSAGKATPVASARPQVATNGHAAPSTPSSGVSA